MLSQAEEDGDLIQLSKSTDVHAPKLSQLLMELGRKISNSIGTADEQATGIPGLMLYRCTAPTPPNPCTYEPSLLVIAQGRKRVDLGRTSYVFGQSRFLLTSVELPIVSRVITASVSCPYGHEFSSIPEAASPSCGATADVHGRTRCG